MKRLNYLLTLLCLLCGTTPMMAQSFEDGGIYYNVTDATNKTVEVTDGETKYTGAVVIPATASDGSNTYTVTSIGDLAFINCSGLTSITIPNSVTSIGNQAFYYCGSLTSITIPNSVTSIGTYTFSHCTGLTSVTIPNSVESIGTYAFANCTGLTSITIPNSVESIGEHAFYYCKSLTSITIPNSVTNIANNAFNYCSGLTSVTIPNSVKSIGLGSFFSCESLTSITIPNSVESIGKYAFNWCTGLTTVAILGGATSIGDNAFSNCNVETFYVPYESAAAYKANANLAEHSDKIKGSIDVELKEATIGGAYASVYLPFPATLVEGDAKAYVGENLEAGTLTLARATEIAANEGFILYADAPCTATLRVGATEEAATSIIEGTNTDIALTDDNRADYLVFGISNGEIGFFKPAASIGSIPANKAFLPNTGDMSAVRMFFNDGETTDIEIIERSTSGRLQGKNGQLRMDNGPVYDLSGRRVTSPAKGSLYIRNGQKFIWK